MRRKNEVCPQGTYTTHNSIFITSVVLYSITKGISEIRQLEREKWLSEILQKHKCLVMFSSIFIHSETSGNDKKRPLTLFWTGEGGFAPSCLLTLFDMGGGMMPPKMFLTTVPKRLGGGS